MAYSAWGDIEAFQQLAAGIQEHGAVSCANHGPDNNTCPVGIANCKGCSAEVNLTQVADHLLRLAGILKEIEQMLGDHFNGCGCRRCQVLRKLQEVAHATANYNRAG